MSRGERGKKTGRPSSLETKGISSPPVPLLRKLFSAHPTRIAYHARQAAATADDVPPRRPPVIMIRGRNTAPGRWGGAESPALPLGELRAAGGGHSVCRGRPAIFGSKGASLGGMKKRGQLHRRDSRAFVPVVVVVGYGCGVGAL